MDNISVENLNDLFIDTIHRCTCDLVCKDDETIEYELFEEFDIGANSFLHEDNLRTLLKANFIDKEIEALSFKLREKYLSLGEDKLNANSVRNDRAWWNILRLSDSIKEKKHKFDLRKQN